MKKFDEWEELFLNKILTVYDLHIYVILKFVLRAINGYHSQLFCNDLFSFNNSARPTTTSKMALLKEPLCRTKIKRYSIRTRGALLFNELTSPNYSCKYESNYKK